MYDLNNVSMVYAMEAYADIPLENDVAIEGLSEAIGSKVKYIWKALAALARWIKEKVITFFNFILRRRTNSEDAKKAANRGTTTPAISAAQLEDDTGNISAKEGQLLAKGFQLIDPALTALTTVLNISYKNQRVVVSDNTPLTKYLSIIKEFGKVTNDLKDAKEDQSAPRNQSITKDTLAGYIETLEKLQKWLESSAKMDKLKADFTANMIIGGMPEDSKTYVSVSQMRDAKLTAINSLIKISTDFCIVSTQLMDRDNE